MSVQEREQDVQEQVETADRVRRRLQWCLAAGVVVIVVLLYARTANEGLYLDDHHHVRQWTWSEVLGTFHGPFDPLGLEPVYFRPLVVVTGTPPGTRRSCTRTPAC